MDNLPSATKYVDETNPAKPVTIYDLGFPLGFRGSADIPGTKAGVSYLNNHLLLTIKYHKDESFDVGLRAGGHLKQAEQAALALSLRYHVARCSPHCSPSRCRIAGLAYRRIRSVILA